MGFIKNYHELAKSPERKIVLDLIEAALFSIQPENVFNNHFKLAGSMLKILDQTIDLSKFEHIFLLGFGKGSAGNCAIVERILGSKLSGGWDIDVVDAQFSRLEYTKGTHPVVSETNVEFTQKVIEKLATLNERNLVLIVTCGGGSALLESPTVPLEKLIAVDEALLESGANIHDMNVIRKHLSKVKGGDLAKIIYPAKAVNLIFSDVPGNDFTVIASGPTVPDPTTQDDAWEVYSKFGLSGKVPLKKEDFTPTTSGEAFKNVDNILFLSNLTALNAMQNKAKELGFDAKIYSDHFQAEAKKAGGMLLKNLTGSEILLVGGETTVKAKGGGEGGRNQELVLAALDRLEEGVTIASFDSDGWDNSEFCGAIGDNLTLRRALDLKLDRQSFINRNDSFNFFKAADDGIETGRLPSNVSDLMIVYRK